MTATKAKWQTFADAKPKPGAQIVVEVVRRSVRLCARQSGTGFLVYDRELQKEYRTPPRMEAYEHRSECRRGVYCGKGRGKVAVRTIDGLTRTYPASLRWYAQ